MVVYGVMAMYRGWIISKAQVDRMEKSYQLHIERLEDDRRQQVEDWKSALQIREAGNQALLSQNTKLLEVVYRIQSPTPSGDRETKPNVPS